MKRWIRWSIIVPAMLASGCRHGPEMWYQPPEQDKTAATAALDGSIPDQPPQEPGQCLFDDRKVVRTAEMEIQTGNPPASACQAENIARQMHGFVKLLDDTCVTLCVPTARFYEAMDRLAELGAVIHRHIKAVDVTSNSIDLDARLRNALATRDRLKELLDKAGNVEDALKIEEQMARVMEEIECLQARQASLAGQTTYCTIAVRFVPPPPTPEPEHTQLPFDWLRTLSLGRLMSF